MKFRVSLKVSLKRPWTFLPAIGFILIFGGTAISIAIDRFQEFGNIFLWLVVGTVVSGFAVGIIETLHTINVGSKSPPLGQNSPSNTIPPGSSTGSPKSQDFWADLTNARPPSAAPTRATRRATKPLWRAAAWLIFAGITAPIAAILIVLSAQGQSVGGGAAAALIFMAFIAPLMLFFAAIPFAIVAIRRKIRNKKLPVAADGNATPAKASWSYLAQFSIYWFIAMFILGVLSGGLALLVMGPVYLILIAITVVLQLSSGDEGKSALGRLPVSTPRERGGANTLHYANAAISFGQSAEDLLGAIWTKYASVLSGRSLEMSGWAYRQSEASDLAETDATALTGADALPLAQATGGHAAWQARNLLTIYRPGRSDIRVADVNYYLGGARGFLRLKSSTIVLTSCPAPYALVVTRQGLYKKGVWRRAGSSRKLPRAKKYTVITEDRSWARDILTPMLVERIEKLGPLHVVVDGGRVAISTPGWWPEPAILDQIIYLLDDLVEQIYRVAGGFAQPGNRF